MDFHNGIPIQNLAVPSLNHRFIPGAFRPGIAVLRDTPGQAELGGFMSFLSSDKSHQKEDVEWKEK
jgi:hypothetical protein